MAAVVSMIISFLIVGLKKILPKLNDFRLIGLVKTVVAWADSVRKNSVRKNTSNRLI